MRMRKLTVFPIPYAHIDANGRLAGATPVGESLRKTSVMPARSFVGATRELLEHDTNDRGPQLAQFSRSEYRFVWGAEPVEVDASGALTAYYQQLANAGDLVILKEGAGPPLEKLAVARAAAIRQYRAEQSHEAPALENGVAIAGTGCPKLSDPKATCDCISDPDTSEWAEQFPLDHDVEAVAALLAERAAKKIEDAKTAEEKSAADAKEAAEKVATEKKAALEKAKSEAQRRARIVLGIEEGLVVEAPSTDSSSNAEGASSPPQAPTPAPEAAAPAETKTSIPRRPPTGSKES